MSAGAAATADGVIGSHSRADPRPTGAMSSRSRGPGTARDAHVHVRGVGHHHRAMARVLIVDDTEIVRKALELALRRMGHEIESASSALVALELARARPPDLALLDVCMPVMDGVALFGEMQVALGDRCPKVLFISATSPEELNPSTALVRVAGYVTKPFLLEELSRAVAGASRGGSTARAMARWIPAEPASPSPYGGSTDASSRRAAPTLPSRASAEVSPSRTLRPPRT